MIGIMVSVMFAIVLVLHRLARPYESVSRTNVPGMLVYRFGGPLYFFNAAHFADRVWELIETASPPVNFLLINAEAIVDMDINAAETLEEVQNYLKRRNVAMGICEVKGHFRRVLMSTHLPARVGFTIYASVAEAVRKLNKEHAAEEPPAATKDEPLPSS
jgi:MFS superfamily sulfate permease-like transporter